MKAQSIPAIVMASIAFYAGLYHLLIYLRRKQPREDLFFSLLCLATGFYDVFCAGLYNASSVAEGAQWQRLQFIALAVFTTAFLWFASDYTRQKPGIVTWAFSIFYLFAILVQIADRSALTWLVDQPAIKKIVLPLDLRIIYYEATLGPFTVFQGLVGLVASTYILWIGVRFYRRGNRRRAIPLFLALGLIYSAAVNDTLIGNNVYPFIYAIEYSYIAMILLMAYSLSSAVVEAAMTKEGLRASEERFRSLVETTNDWVWETDPNGVYTYASPKIRSLLGYEPEEIVGKSPFDFMASDEAKRVGKVFWDTVNGRRPFERLENTTWHRDGRLVILETSGMPFFDANGNLAGYRGIDRDITERKQAEEALRESEMRWQFALEGSGDGVWDWNAQTNQVYYSRQWKAMLGFEEHEIGDTLAEWDTRIHPDDRDAVSGHVSKHLEGKTPVYTSEHRLQCKDGAYKWILDRGQVIEWTKEGKPLRVIGTHSDITRRKQAEEALQESEEKFRSIVENALAGVFTIDDAYHFVYVNDELCRILSYSREDLLGTDFRNVLTDDSRSLVADRYVRRQRGEQPPSRYEFSLVRRDGQVRYAEMSATVVRDTAGRLRTIGQLVDITERKQAESERETLIAELATQNAELERFTYTVSHDLKSPLITIKGFLGFLEQDVASGSHGRVEHDVETIGSAVDKMRQLLDELLELSRIGRVFNPLEQVSTTDLAQEAAATVAGTLSGYDVQVSIAPDMPVVVGDRTRLREIFENLLNNAAKFMGDQPQPQIEIGARESDGEPVFYVRDNGIGIEPQYQNKIFDLFEKLDANSEGTGVGLAIVKRIVETHGGRIWVESEGLGHGSTFCFVLPRDQSAHAK